jgi:hypothetical protein
MGSRKNGANPKNIHPCRPPKLSRAADPSSPSTRRLAVQPLFRLSVDSWSTRRSRRFTKGRLRSLSSVMTVHVGLFSLMMALRDGKFNSAVHALRGSMLQTSWGPETCVSAAADAEPTATANRGRNTCSRGTSVDRRGTVGKHACLPPRRQHSADRAPFSGPLCLLAQPRHWRQGTNTALRLRACLDASKCYNFYTLSPSHQFWDTCMEQ